MGIDPGTTIAGKYVVRRLLGQGGYGAVYEAEHAEIGKRVAVKVIARQHAHSPESIARFRREARAAGRIESEYIVQVFDVGEDAQHGLFMVMELLKGEDLRRKLDRVGRLPIDFALRVAYQIASGLSRAHAAGVVHRDLKPANVFLHDPEGEGPTVKIVDFGVSKLLAEEEQGATPLTVIGRTVGTPQYMSPEQLQGEPFDHRSDVWALGVLLHEMLSGQPAYPELGSFQETALSIVRGRPAALSELVPQVPPALEALLGRALAHEPKARLPDCAAFADALVALAPSSGRQHRSDPIALLEFESTERRIIRVSTADRDVSSETDSIGTSQQLAAVRVQGRRGRAGWLLAGVALLASLVLLASFVKVRRGPPAEPVAATPSDSLRGPVDTAAVVDAAVEHASDEDSAIGAMATPSAPSAAAAASASSGGARDAALPAPAHLPNVASAVRKALPTSSASDGAHELPPTASSVDPAPKQFGGAGVSSAY